MGQGQEQKQEQGQRQRQQATAAAERQLRTVFELLVAARALVRAAGQRVGLLGALDVLHDVLEPRHRRGRRCGGGGGDGRVEKRTAAAVSTAAHGIDLCTAQFSCSVRWSTQSFVSCSTSNLCYQQVRCYFSAGETAAATQASFASQISQT